MKLFIMNDQRFNTFYINYKAQPTLSWPSGKETVAVTTVTWVQFMLGENIYNAWISGKNMKPSFFFHSKKKKYKARALDM